MADSHLIFRLKAVARWCSIRITMLVRFITHDIWLLRIDDLSRFAGNIIRDLRVVILMMRTFTEQKIGYQITALAFKSILAVIPAIAIALFLTDTVGLREKFAELLYRNLGEENIIQALLGAADNIVKTAESGLFGFISMASFAWIVLSLMIQVRKVFNNVWRIKKERSFMKMAFGIFCMIVLSPFVVMIFFTGTIAYSNILDWILPDDFFLSRPLKGLMSWAILAGCIVMLFSAMYKYIPGTYVRYRHALKAAVFAGLIFTGIQFLYIETQIMVSKQSAVYGVLAAVPLFMIWLETGWSIILYGAELSYAFQNVNKFVVSARSQDAS